MYMKHNTELLTLLVVIHIYSNSEAVNVYTSLFPDVLRISACGNSLLWKHYSS